jgi:hypothetical protein
MMFKLFPVCPIPQDRFGAHSRVRNDPRWLTLRTLGILGLLLVSACRSAPPLPRVDLRAPGWNVRQGQAIWTPARNTTGIAGEILVATGPSDRVLVQFSKNPFPMVTAGAGPDSWELAIPTQGKRYSYPGKPPKRVLWFQLPSAIAGRSLAKPWIWTSSALSGRWRLSNPSSGESLEGYFGS